jgi:CRP-like cAMP-binding protein
MDEKRIVEVLKEVPIFTGLDKHHLGLIAKIITVRQFEPGDVIVKQGDSGIGFYIIESGKAEVFREKEAEKVKLNELQENEFFGEMALFEETPRSATVVAAELTTCFVITRWHFRGAIEANPKIAVQMLEIIAKRFSKMARSGQ